MGLAHFAIGMFNDSDNNSGVIAMTMVFTAIFCWSSGPLAWVYAAETTADVAMGVCLLTLWGTVVVLTFVCPILMEPENLGPSAMFYSFSGISFVATLYVYFFIKETFGLSDKEKKQLYMPKKRAEIL